MPAHVTYAWFPADGKVGANENRHHDDAGRLPRNRWFEAGVLDDPISPRLVDPDGPAYKTWSEFLERLPTANRLRLTHYLLRSRYAEDCLAEAFTRGLRQYVILGAGLDTFAYRQPDWASDP
jgi:O-methyltransferase involved in polyketide biosynthesis